MTLYLSSKLKKIPSPKHKPVIMYFLLKTRPVTVNENIDKFASHKCNYLRSPEDETRLFRPADKIYSGTTASKNFTP